jgi:hypothetical protein
VGAAMAVIIDSSSRLHHDQDSGLALRCPHCSVLAHITPVSVPDFNQVQAHKPSHVGIVYRCEACNAPIFLRFAVKLYAGSRIELNPAFTELERPREKFNPTYLPEGVDALFREAISCFSNGCYVAFASMCRRTAQAVFADLGENAKLGLYDQLGDVRQMAEIDDRSFAVVKQVIFGNDGDPRPNLPTPDNFQAGVLLEIMKDLLYQAYVRRGRLQQAMMVRRYFAEESGSKVTAIDKARS